MVPGSGPSYKIFALPSYIFLRRAMGVLSLLRDECFVKP
jgi:hypothetical protein